MESQKILGFKCTFKAGFTALNVLVENGSGFKWTHLKAFTPNLDVSGTSYFVVSQEEAKKLPEMVLNEIADVLYTPCKLKPPTSGITLAIIYDKLAYVILEGYFTNID